MSRMSSKEFEEFLGNEIAPLVVAQLREHEQHVLNIELLRERYPHLVELCAYFERCSALTSLREDGMFTLPSPVILLGEPGCGKTDFCLYVADQLNAEAQLFDCACSSAGFLLTGTSSSWRGGKRGIVYKLVHSETTFTKPFLILDEIEKARGDSQCPILPALGGLFEATTAARFTDEYQGELANANNINFICTANSLEGIPPHILNRCEIIKCPLPTQEQQIRVMKSLWNDLKCDLFADIFEISPAAWHLFGSISLREVKRALTHAVALCVLAKKTTIGEHEIHAALNTNMSNETKIGFI